MSTGDKQVQKRKVSEPLQLKHIENEQFVQKQMSTVLGEQSAEIKEARFSRMKAAESTAWMRKRDITTQLVEGRIEQAVGMLHRDKALGSSELSKRAKKFEEKARLQEEFLLKQQEYDRLHDTAATELALGRYDEKSKSDPFLEDGVELTHYAQLLRDFGAYTKQYADKPGYEKTLEHMDRLLNTTSRKDTEEAGIDVVLAETCEADLTDLAYKNDEEFIKNYSRNYAKIRALSHAKKILDDLPDKGESLNIAGVDTLKLRAKIEILEKIRADYDARMELINSPFYTLLAGKDIEKELGKTDSNVKDEELKRYLENAKKLSGKDGVGKGTDIKKLEKATIEKYQKKDFDDTFVFINDIYERYTNYLKVNNVKAGGMNAQVEALMTVLIEKYGKNEWRDEVGKVLDGLFNTGVKRTNPLYKDDDMRQIKSWDKLLNACLTEYNRTAYKTEEDQAAKHTLDVAIADSVLYADTYNQKLKLLREAIGRRFKDLDEKARNEMIEKYSGGTGGRCVMLMEPENAEYNDYVVEYEIKMDELSGLKGKRSTEEARAKKDNREPVIPKELSAAIAKIEAEIAVMVEKIAVPKLLKMMDSNLEKVETLSDEELIARQEELIKISMPVMMLSDMTKDTKIDANMSVKEKMLGKPAPELEQKDPEQYKKLKAEYEYKAAVFSALAVKVDAVKLLARAKALKRDKNAIHDLTRVMTDAEFDHLRERPELKNASRIAKLEWFIDELEKKAQKFIMLSNARFPKQK